MTEIADKARGAATSWMTDRMVADRCMRMWRNGQWKRLSEFCAKEPRGRTWVVGRIAAVHAVAVQDPRAERAFMQLTEGRNPLTRLDGSAGEVVQDISDDDVEVVESVPAVAVAPGAAPPARLDAFAAARDEGDFHRAGEALVAYGKALAPGAPNELVSVEVREVLAELARMGDLRLIIDVVQALPSRLTTGALHDLGEKLRVGALLHGAALRFHHALEQNEGRSAVKDAEKVLLEDVRKTLQQHGVE